MNDFILREATKNDLNALINLYRSVAQNEGGIARLSDEITDSYVNGFLSKSLTNGLILVAEKGQEIISEIHAYRPGIKVFDHVFSDLTIVVANQHQGKGIGKQIFTAFLELIKSEMKTIRRVEMIARESNHKAIRFYESIGFKIEGRFENRIKTTENKFEADIPMGWENPNYAF